MMTSVLNVLNKNRYFRSLQQVWNGEDVAQLRLQFVSAFIVSMSVLFLVMHPMGIFTKMGFLCTAWATGVAILYFTVMMERTTTPSLPRLGLFLLVGLTPLIYFEGSNAVNRFRYQELGVGLLYDRFFLEIDTQLFGRFFPKGQLSLFLDLDPVIGVTTFIGRCMTEVLQVAYTSYYLWGNGLIVFLGYCYFRDKQVHIAGQPPLTQSQQWRRLVLLSAAWSSTFLLNFLLNLIFPAVSPRIFIADEYKNPLRGLFFADLFRNAIANVAANSFSAFPSGHCGLSWLTVAMARAMGLQKYYIVTLIASIVITFATVALRYHYIIDAIGAIVLYKFGVFIGFLDSPELFHLAVTQSSTGQVEAHYTAHSTAGKPGSRGTTSDEGFVSVRVLNDEDEMSDV